MKTLKLFCAAAAAVVIGFVFGALDARAAEPIAYLDWNPETRQLEERTVTEYTVIDENWTPTELNGWYVVDGEEVDKGGLSVNGEAHIILKDGSSLYLHTAGLHVGASGSTTNAVTIYGQQEGTGVLSAWGASGCAAIGGQSYEDCGRVTINGGRVIAERGSSASGIGGGREGDGGTVTINGGTLDVPQSSSYSLGAGIGGGRNGGAGGVVTINGGCVSVYGGSKAAGIGGGSSGGAGATVTVNGGRVMAYGGANAAGIGGGDGGVGGAFVMNGGWVRSNGAGTAGIGSGASVTGLHGDFMVLSSDIAVAAAGSSRLMTNTTATAYAVSRDRQVCLWHRKFTGPVAYMDWDESSMTLVERTVESCMIVDADTPFIRLEGWCVVEGVVSNTSLAAGTDARLILKDDALLVLDATNDTSAPGFLVDEDESKVNSLRIYGQSAGTGCLCAYGGEYGAGIGGAWSSLVGGKTCGNVSIYGGTINAQVQAYGYGAGIGGASGGDGGTVTIFGGQVTATSFNAGIGGGKGGAGGVVTINGGKVVAGGGSYSAGIGGGEGGAGGVVTINGGKVVAGGGSCSAGIGGGEGGDGGTVTINAGEVTATSGGDGAGIGGGSGGDGGDVTINGGKVTVVSDAGAGIGGGYGGSGGTATIAGGTVTAKSAWAAGIGAGCDQTEQGYLIAWDGFTVASSSGDAPLAVTTFDEYQTNRLGNVCFWKMNAVSDVPYWAWDESAGELVERTAASCVVIDGDWIQTALTGWYVVDGEVALSNLVVSGEAHLILKDGAKLSVGSAKASEPAIKVVRKDEVVNSLAVYGQEAGTGRLDAMTSLYNCVGIGGDWQEECGRVTIHGGIVAATGTEYGAGIGSSYRMKGGEVTINGGTVTAQGGRLGAGIGGGYQGGGGTLVVNGGVVTATGGENATGIGGGCEGGGGTLEVNGGVVTATGGAASAGIGGGRDCAGGQVTINGGTVRATGGNGGAGIGGGMRGAGGPVAINGGTVTATGGLEASGIGCGAYGWDHKSLTIAETLMVIAGATATTAVEMSADDYIYGRHGYVNVAPKTCVTIPAELSGLAYVVSNMTDGVALEPASIESGLAVYTVRTGVEVKVFFTPETGYVLDDSATNPLDLGVIIDAVVLTADDLPTVIPQKGSHVLFDSFAPGPLNLKGATYNGFLGEESLGGTFTLAVKKPKNGTSAATLTKVDPASGKKVKVKGTVNAATGVCGGGLAGLQLNAKGVGGSLGGLPAQGAVDGAKAKDAAALAVMNGFDKRAYGLVFADAAGERAYLTATFSKKGKVKVAGTFRGAKVSGKAQLCVGDGLCAAPFVWSKKGVRVSFVLWFDRAKRALVDVSGLGAGATLVDAGSAATPAGGTYLAMMSEDNILASVPAAIPQTPLETRTSFDGKKFDAGKPAKVTYKKGVLDVNTEKGGNVSGLKLAYSKGALKGGFTVYAVTGGKLVKNKFKVAGVVVDGVGYAVGTNKKLKSIPLVLAK